MLLFPACRATSITVTDLDGQLVRAVCASKTYNVNIEFPEARLSYVSLRDGSVDAKNAANKK
jgi:hypothetical protein